MTIIHKIDDFLFELFSNSSSDRNLNILKDELTRYYTYGAFKPNVMIEGDFIRIDVDTPAIISQDSEYRKAVSLCEKGNYHEAKKILSNLLQQNPTNSEYHRIYGQILSEEGDQEEAVNVLIDALRWDSKNEHALVMMGNIFTRYKRDIDTAMKYYDQVLAIAPDNYIAVNNIGANLLQMGKVHEGIEYLEKAHAINPNYPNTLYGLAAGYDKIETPLPAFGFAIQALKAIGNPNDPLYKVTYGLATQIAEGWAKSGAGKQVFQEYKEFLEKKGAIPIKVEAHENLPTAAKIEFAENYDRDHHLIKYKSTATYVHHLMMHELVHLEFVLEAKEEHTNMLFVSGSDKRMQFLRDTDKEQKKLQKDGFDQATISNFMDGLYNGINLQVYNTPIDLFIEDYLFENYQELRPIQFLSLTKLINEGIAAVTHKQAEKLTPKYIHTASKVLNMVNAIQFRDLYGIDLLKQFNAFPYEVKEAERMWTEFGEYRKDRKPGEEYEIVQHWGEDLRIEKYFELVDEEDFRNRPKTLDEVMKSVEEDPFGTEVDKNFKDRETKKFLDTQEEIGTNQAVMWFMVDALKYFKDMSQTQIKKIAFDIAMVGTQGINPAKGHSYKVASIPGKEFSGYHMLAYYYVSWKLAIPEMVKDLNLPFDEEYQLAVTLSNETR